jgi:uncharacterized membrane protein
MAPTPVAPGGMPPPWRRMGPRTRRVVQAVLYETFAVLFVSTALAWAFREPTGSAVGLALLTSGIALVWNVAYNSLFEAWERRQTVRERTWQRRVLHGIGFEGGLALLLVPVMAWWLQTSLWLALVADAGLLVFFFFYTIGFTWVFDRVFGLPQSALSPP